MKSKAQLKREQDLINSLTRRMNSQLMTFKNTYIGDYVNYQVSQIRKIATAFDNLDIEEVKADVIGENYFELAGSKKYTKSQMSLFCMDRYNRQYGNDKSITRINTNAIERAKQEMSIIECLKVEFYAEANRSYEAKLEKLVLKMATSGIDFDTIMGLNIDFVKDRGHEFEILVYPKTRIRRWDGDVQLTDEQMKQAEIDATEQFFHARMIYACGEIKAPHFRFITTTRKNYR
jgi:hypothetical protein